ncbi:NUDIX hydrolase [Haloferula rosea]|uniref:NUDIX hydrolase n=1 Tax=Haloferula rosea TaxID=490093 RepID=A0A934RD34_9BACT|nr:NUDIX hydrolase [Haloferula rosea]MBK1826826.1 NUDIX hydrolase [Haloferula rosea]
MSRQPLLDQLESYLCRYPAEGPTIHRFVDFVKAEPGCFERTTPSGHITGSAWIVAPDGRGVLLTHHRKLDCWLQLGGHADGDPDVVAVAHKEAQEESGMEEFEQVVPGIFDLDIHPIPARKGEPEHLHYDVRYLLRPLGSTVYTVSEESHDLRWVDVDEVASLTTEASMLRMVAKHREVLGL